MPDRSLVLFANSPRVHGYFRKLARAIHEPRVIVRRVGVRSGGPGIHRDHVDAIIEYGMRRKAARPSHGPLRLAAYREIYSGAARLHFAHAVREIERVRPEAVGVWGGNAVDVRSVREAARFLGVPCFQFENGFLPDTTQMDLEGVNAASSVPRDPYFYLTRWAETATPLPDRLVPRRARGRRRTPAPVALPALYFLVPFQVALDSQVLLHSPWIRGMRELFRAAVGGMYLADAGPVALVFKEHPSCPVTYPDLHRSAEALPDVYFANGNSTESLIRGALGVITLNSSVGCEALLLNRPVLALGSAVYAVPGVASSARHVDGIAEFIRDVARGCPPPNPLRERFLRHLRDDVLLPDSHLAPGEAHFAAVSARLNRPSGPSPTLQVSASRGPEKSGSAGEHRPQGSDTSGLLATATGFSD